MSMRKTGETAMNAQSSRSHSIFTIYMETAEDVSLMFIFAFFRFLMVKEAPLKGIDQGN